MGAWFVCYQERVTGPFNENEIKDQVTNGRIATDALVWGRTATGWKPLSAWLAQLPSTGTETLKPIEEKQLWHYALNGVSKGPMPRSQLIQELRGLTNKDEVLVWTKGMKAWADLFEFHDLLEDLGINRREHPRARATGATVLKVGDQAFTGQLRSISSGGFGASHINSNLPIGETVQVEIKSPNIGESIFARATVQYVTDTGFYGFKFQGLSMEAKSRITSFVRDAKVDTSQAA